MLLRLGSTCSTQPHTGEGVGWLGSRRQQIIECWTGGGGGQGRGGGLRLWWASEMGAGGLAEGGFEFFATNT